MISTAEGNRRTAARMIQIREWIIQMIGFVNWFIRLICSKCAALQCASRSLSFSQSPIKERNKSLTMMLKNNTKNLI